MSLPRVAVTVDLEGDYGGEGLRGVDEVLPRLLDGFERLSIRATFFVLGSLTRLRGPAIRGLVERGHLVGSHTMTHAVLDRVDASVRKAELSSSRAALEDVTGVRCEAFRAPFFDLPSDLGPALEDGEQEDAPAAHVAVQQGEVGDLADVGGLVEAHEHRRVEPAPVAALGHHGGLDHEPIGQRRHERGGAGGAVLGQEVHGLLGAGEVVRVELDQVFGPLLVEDALERDVRDRCPLRRSVDRDVQLPTERFELVGRSGAVRVRGDEERATTQLDDVPRQLGGRGGLARTLQTDHRDDGRVAR